MRLQTIGERNATPCSRGGVAVAVDHASVLSAKLLGHKLRLRQQRNTLLCNCMIYFVANKRIDQSCEVMSYVLVTTMSPGGVDLTTLLYSPLIAPPVMYDMCQCHKMGD